MVRLPVTVHNAQTFMDEKRKEGLDGKATNLTYFAIHASIGVECFEVYCDSFGGHDGRVNKSRHRVTRWSIRYWLSIIQTNTYSA